MPVKKTTNSNSTTPKSSFRLYRSETNRILGGVCGGLAEVFDIDASIVRLIFVLLFVFGGSGLLVYILLWLVIPSQSSSEVGHDTIHKGVDEMRGRAHEFAAKFGNPGQGSGRPYVGWILLLLGILFLSNNFGLRAHFDALLPFIFIIVGFLLISRNRK